MKIFSYRNISVWSFLAMLLVICQCNSPKDTPVYSHQYLFISHTYNNSDPEIQQVDKRVEQIVYDSFELVILGGDIMHNSTKDAITVKMIDDIFDLSSPNTHWVLGNHDYDNPTYVPWASKKPFYYSFHENGITFIVLDTQDSACHITGWQKKMFLSVIDTIKNSTHLILLHHKLIWLLGNSELNKHLNISNGEPGTCHYCLQENNFYQDIYLPLIKVQKQGINVICVGGDLGNSTRQFEYKTPEGIIYLASGIKNEDQQAKILIFYHDPESGQLSWRFELLNDYAY